MNINFNGNGNSMYGGLGGFGILSQGGLKSTAEKQARQAKCQTQINYWEKKKESLKNMECATVEDIAAKLELYHTYEDSITAAKLAYNNEQMWHVLDEARERGEKIAEAAEKLEAKTAEERRKDLREELSGETGGGLLDQMMDSLEEMVPETSEILPETENTEALENLPKAENVDADIKDVKNLPGKENTDIAEVLAEGEKKDSSFML